jgi:hypothetical protein
VDELAEHEVQRNTSHPGDGSEGSESRVERPVHPIRECTFKDFLNCQPFNLRGTEGVIDLTQWFGRMESVFRISHCSVENQVMFATCTLLGTALTWRNSHVRTIGQDTA